MTRLAALVLVLATAPAVAQEDALRTTQDGVYTAEQAERGKEGYTQACAGCHALDWYRGATLKSWDGAPLVNLYDAIATTMPKDNPGRLKRREYLDLLAYILSLNDMPVGAQELAAGPDALKKILIKWRDKP